MSRSSDRFAEAARAVGHDVEIRRFPAGTKTAEHAAAAIGCELGQIVKSLVFVADDRPILALTSGANRADTGKLAALVGAVRVRRADPDEVRAATGFPIGGTPPFGHPSPVETFVDRELMGYEEVWAGAGTSDAVFGIAPDDLVRASGGTVVDLRQADG
jgi:prolyl-tRNA editing enzyme YbaK/EbsC (Cys-tRNA(Pro) deacylase)